MVKETGVIARGGFLSLLWLWAGVLSLGLLFSPGQASAQYPSSCNWENMMESDEYKITCEPPAFKSLMPGVSGVQVFTFWNNTSEPVTLPITVGTYNLTSSPSGSVNVYVPAHGKTRLPVNFTMGGGSYAWLTITWMPNYYTWLEADIRFDAGGETDYQVVPGEALSSYQSPASSPVNGFANVYTHSTVPYFTMDTPRSFTLVHNSDQVAPYPLAGIDFIPHYGSDYGYNTFTLGVSRTGGSAFQFTNGETTLYFSGSTMKGDSLIYDDTCLQTGGDIRPCERWMNRGGPSIKLYGRLDLRSEPTGIIPVTASLSTGNVSAYLLNVNTGRDSTYGRGWGVAGLQRLYWDNSVTKFMVVEPGGPTVLFTGLNTDAQDYSSLSYSSGVYTRSYRDGTKALFNSTGYMTELNHPRGDTTRFEYTSNKLTAIKDPMRVHRGTGTYLSISYDGNGRIASVTETGGSTSRSTTYTVDSNGKLTRITDPDSYYTDFTYDSDGRLKTVTDRKGAVTGFAYNSTTGKLQADTLATVPIDAGSGSTSNGRPVVRYTHWSQSGVPTSATSGTAFPLLSSDTAYSKVNDSRGTTKYVTDAYGQVTKFINARGDVTQTDRVGFYPSVIRYPDGAVDQFEYTDGSLTREKLSGATEWTTYYNDGFGLPYQIFTDPLKPEYRSTNSSGNLESVYKYGADGQARTLSFTYDSYGRLKTSDDTYGTPDTTYYDTNTGNASGSWTVGNVVSNKTFDDYGRVKTTRAAQGQPTDTTFYDVMNRVTSHADGVNTVRSTFTYDQLYLLRVTDPKGQVAEKVEVDALGRVTKRYDTYDTLSTYQTFRYDSAGRLTSSTNRRNQRVDRTYDSMDNLTGRSYTSGSDSYSTSYLGSDASNSYASTSTSIDPVTRFRSTTVGLGGESIGIRHKWGRGLYSYFNADTLAATYSGGNVFNWVTRFDTATGMPDSVESNFNMYNSGGGIIGYGGFTFDGKPNSIGGTGFRYTSRRQSGTVGGASVTRDSLDRIQSFTAFLGHAGHLAYDGLGRLVADSADTTYTHPPCDNFTPDDAFGDIYGIYIRCPNAYQSVTTWTYDEVGNKTDNSGTYDLGNRMLTYKGYTFEHDADGNITRKYKSGFDLRYRWDELGRLARVVNAISGDSLEFTYDAMDHLIRRKKNSTVERYFLWDEDNLVGEFKGNMNRIISYKYDGIDHPIMSYSALWNNSGYVDVDAAGNVGSWYDAWGIPTAAFDTTSSLRWKGLHHESGSVIGGGGLYYMRARWYDPELGRFLSEDPIGIQGGINQYTFANNDPINGRDPSGLCSYYDSDQNLKVASSGAIMQTAGQATYQCLMDGPGAGWEKLAAGTTSLDNIIQNGRIITGLEWQVLEKSLINLGEGALQHWASIATDPNASFLERAGANIAGTFSALWTRDTALQTGLTLVSAYGLRNAGSAWYLRDGSKAYTFLDYGDLFRLEKHMIGRGALRASRWHIDALGGLVRHFPWGI